MNKNQMETIVRWKELESQLIEAIKRKDEENETRIRKQMKELIDCSEYCCFAAQCSKVCYKKAFVFNHLWN